MVPWFLTRGYFVEKVLTEQFSDTPIPCRIVEPLGSRPEIAQLIKKRAQRLRGLSLTFRFTFREVLKKLMGTSGRSRNEFAIEQSSLLLASHGTPLHAGSRKAADRLAEELKKDGYQVSRAMFLEEEPKIADWRQVAALEGPVMVLPHFLAGGLHGSKDVPGLLGIPSGKEGWYEVEG